MRRHQFQRATLPLSPLLAQLLAQPRDLRRVLRRAQQTNQRVALPADCPVGKLQGSLLVFLLVLVS